MPKYYFFQRNNNFCNGQPTLRTIECNFDRWADVRTKIEEMLGVSRLAHTQGRKTEPASLFGCVVGNKLKHHDWHALQAKSRLLPALENGSLLIDGDLIIVAVVPFRSTLYYQDLWHRYWLYSLMKKYYTSRGQEQEFERDARRYDLKKLVCRITALAEQKANPTINLKHKNQILKTGFENATQRFAPNNKYKLFFEFGASYQPCFGQEIYRRMCNELQNINIDFNHRTKFLTRLIRESGGEIEFGDNIAKRLGIENVQLVQLVRDTLHNYDPQYIAKDKVEDIVFMEKEEEEKEEEKEEEEKLSPKRRKIQDDGLEGFLIEQERLAKLATPEEKKHIEETQEIEKIQKVIDGANDASLNKQPIFNMQVYCMCCDVPGHHTNSCPRLEFLENLRVNCHHVGPIPWSIFYAPENGICPIPFSTLARFVSQHFPSRAGEINRKIAKSVIEDEFVLPTIPYYANTRWIIDP